MQDLHAAAGFPTKAMCIKAITITSDFYTEWPLLTLENISKLFPEYDEMITLHIYGP